MWKLRKTGNQDWEETKNVKNKKKIISTTVLVVLILAIPIPIRYKDGGSIKYKAILYEAMKYHQICLNLDSGYKDGWSIKILGMEIYNSVEDKLPR